MKLEKEASGKTVEAAILAGVRLLGVDRDKVSYEIIEMPKKGFLGFGEVPAKVKVFYEVPDPEPALDFINVLIKDMALRATAEIREVPGGKLVNIMGEDAGVLIGHHGETLDSLQYLVNLVVNKRDEEDKENGKTYTRITVDIEDYRAKREATLRQLARRMADKVLKYKKSVTLEPMSPYERRIIHSEIQNIEGVSTTSIGTDNNRKIVIFLEEKDAKSPNAKPPYKKPRRPASEELK